MISNIISGINLLFILISFSSFLSSKYVKSIGLYFNNIFFSDKFVNNLMNKLGNSLENFFLNSA